MAAEKLGSAACPLCHANARVSLSRTGLPVITCTACHMQLFARSSHSELLVRAMLKKPDDMPTAKPAPAAAAAPGKAPQLPADKPAAPAVTHEPARNSWNIW